MVSRKLPTSLILSLALTAVACGDSGGTEDTSTTFNPDTTAGDDSMMETTTDDEVGETMDTTADDTTTADGTTTDGSEQDGTETQGTTDTTTTTSETGEPECLDLDQDGYGENCEMGPDCDDNDYNNWTPDGCANCMDADGDGQWVGCDLFDENKPGEDCDDNDFNVYTEAGCANCVDEDMDDAWVGCDQYGDAKPGPDCDDDNPVVGLGDEQEICNGLAENCAGEVDNAPPDEMCPPEGVDAPNVDPMNGWLCDPPAPGEDGCVIAQCTEQFFDLNGVVGDGCECEGTSRTESLAACSDAPQGDLGDVAEGEQLNGLPIGTIPELDNGVGALREDWYWVEFPENDAIGTRPNTGSIQVDFAQNDGNDYRFEVYHSCQAVAFQNGLATAFGAGAPPTTEWSFFDNHTAPIDMPVPAFYTDDVSWPNKVYIRVFRVQNENTCNNYQLSVSRQSN